MKESAVNTDTQQAHYRFEIKITEAEKLEQEKKIVRDFFFFFHFVCGHFHFRKWYTHWTHGPPARQCARRPRSPPSLIEIDDTNIHGAVSFTGVTSISKKTKKQKPTKTKHKTYNSSPQNTPYEGRTPKSVNRSNWSRMWALLLLLSRHACTFTSGSVKAWRGKGLWNLSAAAVPVPCISHTWRHFTPTHCAPGHSFMTAWLVRLEKSIHDGKTKRIPWLCSLGVVAELNRKRNESQLWGFTLLCSVDLAVA